MHHGHAFRECRVAEHITGNQILFENLDPVSPPPPHTVPGHEGLQTYVGETLLHAAFRARTNY
jgi:hypothetical protein